MAAPKGHARYGGRVKGTPNKSSQDLMAICEKHNCIPFEGMVIIASQETDKRIKFDMLEKIAQYVHAKRKALETPPEEPPTPETNKKLGEFNSVVTDIAEERKRLACKR